MTLLVKDANTTVQSLSTEVDGNGNLVPVHAPAATNAQGVSTPVGPQNPLPVINTAGAVASDGSGTVATGGSAQTLFGGHRAGERVSRAEQFLGGAVDLGCRGRLGGRRQHPACRQWRHFRDPFRATSPPARSAFMARRPARPLPRAGGDPDACRRNGSTAR